MTYVPGAASVDKTTLSDATIAFASLLVITRIQLDLERGSASHKGSYPKARERDSDGDHKARQYQMNPITSLGTADPNDLTVYD